MSIIPESAPIFTPKRDCLVSSAYSYFHRWLIVLMLICFFVWGIKIYIFEKMNINTSIHINIYLWLAVGYLMIFYMGITLWRSKTTLTTHALKQDWFWSKTVSFQQISYVRFIRLNGWEWLFAPRLLVKSGSGPFVAFYAASPLMWEEFERWHACFHSDENNKINTQ